MKKLPHPLSHRLRTKAATATALLAALAATPAAQASLVITYLETGADVVATGRGSIDTFDLQGSTHRERGPMVSPEYWLVAIVGPAGEVYAPTATNLNGPTSFGAGGSSFADSSTGDTFGLFRLFNEVILPPNYVSGGALYGTATFLNASFASMEIDPGTYVWTFGSGEHADSITVQIGPTQAAVPEPASLALAGLGLAGLAASRRRKQG